MDEQMTVLFVLGCAWLMAGVMGCTKIYLIEDEDLKIPWYHKLAFVLTGPINFFIIEALHRAVMWGRMEVGDDVQRLAIEVAKKFCPDKAAEIAEYRFIFTEKEID